MAVLLLLSGCGRAPVVVPESPPDAVQAVVEGLTDNRPEVLWEALPPSYQADVRGLLTTFCDHMGADLYDRTFRMLAKAAAVLRKRKDYLFNSPMTLDNPIFETGLGLHWEETVGILSSLLLPVLSKSKAKARSIQCLNHVRQLDLALLMYAADHDDQAPPRSYPRHWTSPLYPYFADMVVLRCPSDAPDSRRSYIINGWNDHFEQVLSAEDFEAFKRFQWPYGMRLSLIHPLLPLHPAH